MIVIIIVTISVNAKAWYNLEIESTRYFWKCTVVSHSWYCPYLVESVMSLSGGMLLRLKYAREFPEKDLQRITP